MATKGMIINEFNSLQEIQKYYNKETNTYVFKEDGCYIELVKFNFDLQINSNIDALDIDALDIEAGDIIANNINANDINSRNIIANEIIANDIFANEINYYALCIAYKNIKCKSIEGERENHKHFVLDGVLEVEDDRKTNE